MKPYSIVGSYGYGWGEGPYDGGLHLMKIATDGALEKVGSFAAGIEAGYLLPSPTRDVIYLVDERKNDGRGNGPTASVQSFQVSDDSLVCQSIQTVLGPFPTYLSVDPDGRWLVCASHGSFDHIERIVQDESGWHTEFAYDDSALALYPLAEDGSIRPLADLVVFGGHGLDPHPSSQQAGGHPQASSHAHCAQFDPSGQFVIVCDKGTDLIHIFRVDVTNAKLVEVYVHHTEPGTAPRHATFHPTEPLLFIDNELASTLTCYRFDCESGGIHELSTIFCRRSI